jgi:hypothetical protein
MRAPPPTHCVPSLARPLPLATPPPRPGARSLSPSYTIGSFKIDRGLPSQLSSAVCCDCLERLAAAKGPHQQLLNLIKQSLFPAIYSGYEEGGSVYLSSPFFLRVRQMEQQIKVRLCMRGGTRSRARTQGA